MSQSPSPSAGRQDQKPPIPRGAVLGCIVVLSGFIAYQGPTLWDEISALRHELFLTRVGAVVGYEGISPSPSMAQKPETWYRVEGDQTHIWGGWEPGKGHVWFQTDTGDLEQDRLSGLHGLHTARAIDRPIVEIGKGPIWDRIPDEHQVVAARVNGKPCAYPLLVLQKVFVVHDSLDRRPFLVLYSPQSPNRASVYNPSINGQHVKLSFSGLFYDQEPLFYDRESQGLWIERKAGLIALSGTHQGQHLPRLGHLHSVSWGHWRDRNADGRVVVGARRDGRSATTQSPTANARFQPARSPREGGTAPAT